MADYAILGYIYHNQVWYYRDGSPVNVNAPYVTSSGSFSNPQIGDLWTIVLPPNVQAADFSLIQTRTGGPVSLSLVNMVHIVDANDKPPVGGIWPLVANANGLTITSTPINVTVTPTGSNVVVLTQVQSPYTLQVSDNGKILAPATTAEFIINVPAGLGASFSCAITPTGNYPTSFQESGAAVSNNGVRLSNANKLADSVVMPGATANLNASSSDILTLTGRLGQWRQCMEPVGLNNANSGAAAYAYAFYTGRLKLGSGAAGAKRVKGLKFEYSHRFSNIETVPAYNADVAFSVEYPVNTTPKPVLFGGVDQVTCTPSVPDVLSDFLPLDAAIGDLIGIHCGQHTGDTTKPCLSGTGAAFNSGDVFVTSTVDGTNWKSNCAVLGSTLSNQNPNPGSTNSPQIMRPSAIIAVVDYEGGATKDVVVWAANDSRQQPSNGDFPEVAAGRAGELGRVLPDNYTILNVGISASQLTFLNDSRGAYRRHLGIYCNTLAINGFINDANKPQATIEAFFAQTKTWPELTSKLQIVRTTSPSCTSTNDYIDLAGQSAAILADSQRVDLINSRIVAKLIPGIDKVIDARPFVEGGTLADGTRGWRFDPGARQVTDGAMTSGSNVLTSVTANFTAADTGHYCHVPNTTGVLVLVQMTYIGPTQVSLGSYRRNSAYNATATLSGLTCNIRSNEAAQSDPGLHCTQRQGIYEQANKASMPPV